MEKSLNLNAIRARATKIFVVLTWVHVAVAIAVAVIAHNAWQAPALIALIVAVVATTASRALKDGLTLRGIIAIAMTCGPILFVYAGRGAHSGISANGDWQIDYHMYFFCIFAMMAAYIDWRPIAIAATVTALHHLILDLVVPANVFPEEGLDRVALHAVAVVAECGVLFWLTSAINRLFKNIESANELVEFTAQETALALMEAQETNTKLHERVEALEAMAA